MVADGGPREGTMLGGRYRLSRQIGMGGMGVVFEATNTWTSRRVAIKCLAGQAVGGRTKTLAEDQVERFMREARATAQVKHPHVVDVLDMGRDEESGTLFIVYELLEGEALRARLDRDGALSPEVATTLLAPVMEAMVAVHGCGVVHRDLKPQNLFLATEGGRTLPKVIDFGIARGLDDDARGDLTRTGAALGTPRYMAPEQCRGAKDLDARVDVWSMGVVWFEALTGRCPYPGAGYHEVLAQILTTDPPTVRSVRPEVPQALARAVDRALARDRERRHATMAAFLEAVRGTTPRTITATTPSRRVGVAAVATVGPLLLLLGATVWRAQPRTRAVASKADAGAAVWPVATLTLDAGVAATAVVTVARERDAGVATTSDASTRRAVGRMLARGALHDAATAATTATEVTAVNGAPLLEP